MRNIAILRDGYSDYLVLKKLVSTLLLKHRDEEIEEKNFIDLEVLNITSSLVKYLSIISKSKNYSYFSDEAKKLVNDLVNIYYACYKKILGELDEISNKSIIIISTDAELLLVDRKNYFNEWAYQVKGILYFSIEKFYELMVSQGYNYEFLPYYIPIVPFPSSEIIVASCMYDFKKENIRQIKPTPGLKMKVYESNSIPDAIESGKLHAVLNKYVSVENIDKIYSEIPEARMLIHTLTS